MLGPYFRTDKLSDTAYGYEFCRFLRTQTWYRSDKGAKVRKPLPYEMVTQILVKETPLCKIAHMDAEQGLTYMKSGWGRSNIKGNTIEALHNQCYAKFLEKVRKSPQVGVDVAERHQTYRMIASILKGLRRPIQNLTKVAKRYRSKPLSSAMSDMPDLWLAFHFGVEPLIKDLFDLLERLEQPAEAKVIYAYRKKTITYNETSYGTTYAERYKLGVRIAAHVTRVDERTALMSDLGLINPASIAWELVPFSFVVDWFYPVGQYISSMSDLLGYKFQDAYSTWYISGTEDQTATTVGPLYNGTISWKAYKVRRRLENPKMVSQYFRIPDAISPSRAATSISLLLQQLKNVRSRT